MPESLSTQEDLRWREAPLEAAPLPGSCEASSEDDARAWQELAAEGFTIKPFLSSAQIEALQQLRVATIPDVPNGFYISVFSAPAIRRAILEGFQSIFGEKLKTLIPGFSLVTASFVTKKAGGLNGRLELHQDSSLVDHRKDFGINVWVPLCDVDDRNGCLRVAGRSHRFNLIGCLPPLYRPHGEIERELTPPLITSLAMKAGEACLFDTRLLHASGENYSDSDRVAAFFSLVPDNRPVRLYFRNPATPAQLDVFQVDREFMLQFDPLHYPDAATRETMTSLGSFDHVQQKLSMEDFTALQADVALPADASRPRETMVAAPVADSVGAEAVSVSRSSLWTGLWKRLRQ